MPDEAPQLSDDPLSVLYRNQVDMTLVRRNLTLTHEQRLLQLMELQRFAEELRRAGRALRGERPT